MEITEEGKFLDLDGTRNLRVGAMYILPAKLPGRARTFHTNYPL